jgi:2-polyprenyl-6-methoxyphenol hydroxylase-like FAD-dependent oxidoreductase
LLIRKGSFDRVKDEGLPAFRGNIRRIAPYLGDRVDALTGWDEIKLLSVQINRLQKWHRPGLLCIGDAAHAMSPAGGVGINLAIQDAVAAANLLTEPLLRGDLTEWDLEQVQRRREFPARVTQQAQAFAHKQLVKVFENPGPAKAPWPLKLVFSVPGVQRALAKAVGMGVRPEHVAGHEPRRSMSATAKMFVAAGVVVAGTVLAINWVRRT